MKSHFVLTVFAAAIILIGAVLSFSGADADITTDPDDASVLVDETIHFTASGAGFNAAYSWDFGDDSAKGAGITVEHSYSKAGDYTVVLTTTLNGQQSTETVKVVVESEYFMDASDLGVILIVIGIIMLVAELFTPGFFIAMPGTVLIILGILGVVMPNEMFYSWYSMLIALVVTIPAAFGTLWIYKRLAPPEAPTTTVGDSLIGKEGKVTVATQKDNIRGKVKIGTTVWSARSDVPLKAGTAVRVVSSEGVHVKVERIK